MKRIIYIALSIVALGNLVSCENSVNVSKVPFDSTNDSLLTLGKTIAKQTFEVLSSHLKHKLQNDGIPEAVNYCNITAYPLTDSISKANNVTIKRVAERYRNPQNKLTPEDSVVFAGMKKNPTPLIHLNGKGNYTFYAPIKLKPMCVMCHGSKEQIAENYEVIQQLYPKDKATGFVPDELRGMWSITFN